MRWLRSLLGNPVHINTTHIHINEGAIAVARPGDVVILSVSAPINQKQREAIASHIDMLRRRAPGVEFAVIERPLIAEVRRGSDGV